MGVNTNGHVARALTETMAGVTEVLEDMRLTPACGVETLQAYKGTRESHLAWAARRRRDLRTMVGSATRRVTAHANANVTYLTSLSGMPGIMPSDHVP